MVKVYLAAPMRGIRGALPEVKELIRLIEGYGHEVLTKHVADDVLDVDRGMSPREVFERDIRLLEEADVMVAEVSYPSLGVGFELAYFLTRGKPAAGLVLEDRLGTLSALIQGITWPNFHLMTYRNAREAVEKLRSRGLL
uniref:Putative 2'-deoxynucleoside 5'-phosphate N-hydrolase 1 n=1 Tax=Thermofilum pendens TaxID=2269 RepID=A0A7J3X5W0_THEPE